MIDENKELYKNPEKIAFFKDLIEDSNGPLLHFNFITFKSINNIFYLIYTKRTGKKKCSIISYDLINNKIINEIKNNRHANFRYFFDKKEKRDLIMVIFGEDRNIKILNVYNFECILDIKDIYTKGWIFSACFFTYKDNEYIITSNNNDCSENKISESIKIFDFNGNRINVIDKINFYNIYYLDVYFDNELSIHFIIFCNNKQIMSYNYNSNIIHHLYKTDNDDSSKLTNYFIIIKDDKEKITKLIVPINKEIQIWNFHTSELLSKFEISCGCLTTTICLWRNDYLFIGDLNGIKLINLKNGKIIKTLNMEKNKCVMTIIKINHPKFGECLLTQATDRTPIKLYIIKD